jgi:hypothetical protein
LREHFESTADRETGITKNASIGYLSLRFRATGWDAG